jgi:hypothetical protein
VRPALLSGTSGGCIHERFDSRGTARDSVAAPDAGEAAIFARNTEGQAIGFTCANPEALRIWIVNTSGVATNGRFSFAIP